MDKFLTISQAAEKLGVNPETLRRWDKSGKFQSIRHPINNYRVYPENQVLSIVEELQIEIGFAPVKKEREILPLYFETKLGKLYKEDAVKFLKSLKDNSVDLIFADPPYNIG